jgi:hypothetical protein
MGWLCWKIMLEEDKSIYISWKEILNYFVQQKSQKITQRLH